ncbi:unnamed protein product [Dicrocoelium dendriticum]|nr:unnamed protein product [Dicrocoelium dendriticum]
MATRIMAQSMLHENSSVEQNVPAHLNTPATAGDTTTYVYVAVFQERAATSVLSTKTVTQDAGSNTDALITPQRTQITLFHEPVTLR